MQMISFVVFVILCFFFQAEDGIRVLTVTGFRRVLFRSILSCLSYCLTVVVFVYTHSRYGETEICHRKLRHRKGGKERGCGRSEKELSLGDNDYDRSEERCVGKGCRSRWAPCHLKKK